MSEQIAWIIILFNRIDCSQLKIMIDISIALEWVQQQQHHKMHQREVKK